MVNNRKQQKSKIFEIPANRKGQGLSINVIIIAAIALLVLIILAVLLARSGGNVSEGTNCITQGGICKVAPCDGDPIPSGKCSNPAYTCCSPVSKYGE